MENKFYSENCAVYEIMCNNILYPDISKMTVWLMCTVYWPKKGCKYKIICNVSLFSTATMMARTRLNITLNVHYLSLSFLCVVRIGASINVISPFH
jgi:hypothetical protein